MKPPEVSRAERVVEPGQPVSPGHSDGEPAGPPPPWSGEAIVGAAARTLADVPAESICLQEHRPLADSLDWELGQLAWSRRASRAFFADKVPFAATSNGRLARNAAELLLTALAEAEARAPLPPVLPVLELGAGLGLFARGFLSAFRDLCRARSADYYDRLLYVVTDKSDRMLDDLRRSRVLDDHPGRWQARRVDALCVRDGLPGTGHACGPFYAVFLNYVLDCLPPAVLRVDASELSELCVETRLARKDDLADYTDMPLDEILCRARSDSAAARAPLADVHDLLIASFRFQPTSVDRVPYGHFVAGLVEPGCCVLHNYGALQCLEGIVPMLHPDGFLLIADYGQADGVGSARPWQPQRFGSSLAIGLNFALLAAFCRQVLGCECLAPAADPGKLRCRLAGPRLAEPVASRFRQLFGPEACAWEREPLTRARACIKHADRDGALEAFAEAVRRQGPNWALLDEIARFLIYRAADYARGLDMARLALELNPVCPGLWTTCADALYYLGRLAEARSALGEALRRHPESPRALLSLVYVHAAQRNYAAALRAVADGLRCDRDGSYRKWLLGQQQCVLDALGRRHEQRRRARAARSDRHAPVERGEQPGPEAPVKHSPPHPCGTSPGPPRGGPARHQQSAGGGRHP